MNGDDVWSHSQSLPCTNKPILHTEGLGMRQGDTVTKSLSCRILLLHCYAATSLLPQARVLRYVHMLADDILLLAQHTAQSLKVE